MSELKQFRFTYIIQKKMNLFFSKFFKKGILLISSITFSLPLMAEVLFRPTKFAITYYQIGFENSATGERWPIFDDPNGKVVDFSNQNEINNLVSNVKAKEGTWDTIYSLVSNSQVVSGSKDGCYMKSGTFTPNGSYDYDAVTTNAALAGEATIVETSLGDSRPRGPFTTDVIGEVNGQGIKNFTIALVSSSNPVVNGGGDIDRRLFYGTLATPIDTTTKKEGTLWMTIDPTNVFLDSCSMYDEAGESGGIRFGLSVE